MPTATSTETVVDQVLGSDIPYITYAFPLFILLIGIELVYSFLAGKRVYRTNDSVADLSCGVIDQITKVCVEAFVLGAYIYLYEHYRFFDVVSWSPAAKWASAIALVFAVDFCFYWHHRFGHEFAAGWAAHAVHHQSEEFNLIVALRQSTLEHHLTFFFYLPLALLGFPPTWYVAMFAFNLIWQFWCHTRLVGKLGPLEWIFITPSHHRVHHGRNPKYLDKNYGGTFIIWDRLFGTFQEEEEEVVYGVTKQIRSWNPIWANLHIWAELGRDASKAPYWWEKVLIWFMPLNWTPPGLEPKPDPPEVSASTFVKYDTKLPFGLLAYAMMHFALILSGSIAFLVVASGHIAVVESWDIIAMILFSLLTIGGIFERKRWSWTAELARLALLVPFTILRMWESTWFLPVAISVAILAALSVLWLIAFRGSFTEDLIWFDDDESPAEGLRPATPVAG